MSWYHHEKYVIFHVWGQQRVRTDKTLVEKDISGGKGCSISKFERGKRPLMYGFNLKVLTCKLYLQ